VAANAGSCVVVKENEVSKSNIARLKLCEKWGGNHVTRFYFVHVLYNIIQVE
jgi:hypothetical protein